MLNVDPEALVRLAEALSAAMHSTHAALPAGWVRPAGAEPHSTVATAGHNARAAQALNRAIGVLHEAASDAHKVGATAVEYTRADVEGARALGGSGGEQLTNRAAPAGIVDVRVPPAPAGVPATVDPLTFAQQLHSGPGPAPARAFADSVRTYLTGAHALALAAIDQAMPTLLEWIPVGATAAARLSANRIKLEGIGNSLGALATDVDAYADAFQTAKARHPTPREIIATRKRLLAAKRAEDAEELGKALIAFQEQNMISAQTVGEYSTKVATTTDPDGKDGKDTGGKEENGPGTDTGTGNTGTGGKQAGSSVDTSMLTAMLPTLMSALTDATSSAGQENSQTDTNLTDLEDELYENLPTVPSYGGPSAPGGDPGAPAPTATDPYVVGPLPSVTAPSPAGVGAPRAPVIDPLTTAAGGGANRAAGSPYMPYMPGAPGAGGGAGGGGERARVVAWHPDRLMYVDKTDFIDAVIGEKPTIAPTVTPLTPVPDNQPHTNTGGSA